MSLTSALAVYFILWWVTLFAVLPWGVRNSHETGQEVAAGHEAGAPVNPRIGRKMLVTTVIASLLFILVYGQITYGWVGFEDIPFLGSMPGT